MGGLWTPLTLSNWLCLTVNLIIHNTAKLSYWWFLFVVYVMTLAHDIKSASVYHRCQETRVASILINRLNYNLLYCLFLHVA